VKPESPTIAEPCAECGRPPEMGEIAWSSDAGKNLCDACASWRNSDTPSLHVVDGDAAPIEFEISTAADLCALPDPPKSQELVGPLLARGARLVLGGHTGEGKTTISLQLVKAVATGGRFLDWECAKGKVLVIDAEQGLKTIKRRLREAGLDESADVKYLRAPDGLALDTNDQEAAAVEAVLAEGDYALVLADPLYKLHRGDSNAEREAIDLMRRFDRWREQYGFGLLLPAHCRKPQQGGADFTMHEFFGSTAYLRGAEVVLGLRRLSDGFSRLHFFKDRDGDLPVGESWGLLFDREDGFRRAPEECEPVKSEEEKADDLRERVLEYLREHGPASQKRVRDAIRGRAQRIQEALRGLESDKLIYDGPDGWGVFPVAGNTPGTPSAGAVDDGGPGVRNTPVGGVAPGTPSATPVPEEQEQPSLAAVVEGEKETPRCSCFRPAPGLDGRCTRCFGAAA
jgi:AAA domain